MISRSNFKKVATRIDDDINEVIKNVIKARHTPVIITGVVLMSMLFLYRRHHHHDDLSSDDDYEDALVV